MDGVSDSKSLLTSTSAMKASSGSSSLSDPPAACICCRVGEFSAGMYGKSTLLLDSSSSSSKYLVWNHKGAVFCSRWISFHKRKWREQMFFCVEEVHHSRILLIKIGSFCPYFVKRWQLLALPISTRSRGSNWCVRDLWNTRFFFFPRQRKSPKSEPPLHPWTAFVPVHGCGAK